VSVGRSEADLVSVAVKVKIRSRTGSGNVRPEDGRCFSIDTPRVGAQ
jgi:hypothetical protein